MKIGRTPSLRNTARGTSSFLLLTALATSLLLVMSSCTSNDNQPSSSVDQVLETLNQNAFAGRLIPITSLSPSTSTEDLSFLSSFVSDKSIVALGESTHGTSEFFTLRHRMIQHMVEKLNFRVLAVETNFSTAQAINAYITGGSGTALEAVQNISGWVYNNQEFVQLIEWLRTFNSGRAPADKVTFYGFDAQSAEAGAKRVQAYVSSYDPAYMSSFNQTAEPFLNDFQELSAYSYEELEQMIPSLVAGYQTRWNSILTYLNTNKSKLIAQSGDRAYDLMLRHWEIVQQTFNGFVHIADELKYFNYRDSYMADNVDWIQKHENNNKVIIWAHAGHSGKNTGATGTQMGYNLKQRHPETFYTIGYFTNGGTVRVVHLSNGVPMLGEATIAPKEEHVLTQAFAKGQWSQFFLPMSAITGNTALENLFFRPTKIYFIGADLERSTVDQTLGIEYDAIVFLEKTKATKAN